MNNQTTSETAPAHDQSPVSSTAAPASPVVTPQEPAPVKLLVKTATLETKEALSPATTATVGSAAELPLHVSQQPDSVTLIAGIVSSAVVALIVTYVTNRSANSRANQDRSEANARSKEERDSAERHAKLDRELQLKKDIYFNVLGDHTRFLCYVSNLPQSGAAETDMNRSFVDFAANHGVISLVAPRSLQDSIKARSSEVINGFQELIDLKKDLTGAEHSAGGHTDLSPTHQMRLEKVASEKREELQVKCLKFASLIVDIRDSIAAAMRKDLGMDPAD